MPKRHDGPGGTRHENANDAVAAPDTALSVHPEVRLASVLDGGAASSSHVCRWQFHPLKLVLLVRVGLIILRHGRNSVVRRADEGVVYVEISL
jgi:hypothetical protein